MLESSNSNSVFNGVYCNITLKELITCKQRYLYCVKCTCVQTLVTLLLSICQLSSVNFREKRCYFEEKLFILTPDPYMSAKRI